MGSAGGGDEIQNLGAESGGLYYNVTHIWKFFTAGRPKLREKMRNKAKILIFSSALVCSAANAGFHEFTMHSRANCGGFNESISWHFNHSYWLLTNSVHVKPNGNYS